MDHWSLIITFTFKHRLQCLHVAAWFTVVVLSCTKCMVEAKVFSVLPVTICTKTIVLYWIQGCSVDGAQELQTVPSERTRLAHFSDVYYPHWWMLTVTRQIRGDFWQLLVSYSHCNRRLIGFLGQGICPLTFLCLRKTLEKDDTHQSVKWDADLHTSCSSSTRPSISVINNIDKFFWEILHKRIYMGVEYG
jgi:hypothetical protein